MSAIAVVAENDSQKASLAELPTWRKHARYEELLRRDDDLRTYHDVSCYPITVRAEADMEVLSDLFTWGERYLHNWQEGIYSCSRCLSAVYSSQDKYRGPCVWPSFRKPINNNAVITREVLSYNGYDVTVKEVYCATCRLFMGHQFEDARAKGDNHPEAHWRH